jgi:hypothetical protein
VNQVEDFQATVTDEATLLTFLARHEVKLTDALIVATLDGDRARILATVDHPHPRDASIVVLSREHLKT